jgi:isocitrate dehydrogenase (NAD+)
VFEAIKSPVEFDLIENFNLKDPVHLKAVTKNKIILTGNVGVKGSHYVENLALYKHLNLYVKVVHVQNYPNINKRHKNIDFVIVRDNLEGEYTGIEHEVYPGVFESLKIITREKAMKVASYAFEYAYLTGRKKVTCIHKANIM